jgi:uncharacterized protein YyaL (SSP411 family)
MFQWILNLFLSPERKAKYAIAEFDRIRRELGRAQAQALVQIERAYERDIKRAEKSADKDMDLLAAQHKYNDLKDSVEIK